MKFFGFSSSLFILSLSLKFSLNRTTFCRCCGSRSFARPNGPEYRQTLSTPSPSPPHALHFTRGLLFSSLTTRILRPPNKSTILHVFNIQSDQEGVLGQLGACYGRQIGESRHAGHTWAALLHQELGRRKVRHVHSNLHPLRWLLTTLTGRPYDGLCRFVDSARIVCSFSSTFLHISAHFCRFLTQNEALTASLLTLCRPRAFPFLGQATS